MTIAKKSRWVRNILIVLVACGIVGLILAVVRFNRNPGRTYASASLQFSFNGAGEGKAPNGYSFDVNGIFSSEVLNNALEASGLAGNYTTDQIKENMTITGMYPENIVKRMTEYISLLDANANQQADMEDYHATQYRVVLYHDFDPKISGDQLRTLLGNILDAYRAYFARTNSFRLEKINPIPQLQEYDYTQQLQAIKEAADQQSRFAQEMADKAPDFRTERKGFDDIVISYTNLKSDIDRLNASITLNTVSKDRERLQKQYEMELRTLNRELSGAQDEIKSIEGLIASYEKDGIVYVSTSGSLQKVSSNASATYDKLVTRRQELTDSITTINADIAKYQAMLDDMTNSKENTNTVKVATEGTEEAKDTEENVSTSVELTEEEIKQLAVNTERQIETLTAKQNKVISDFSAMLDAYARQEINERTVTATQLNYRAPSLLSGEFFVKAVKTAGSICMAGLMICLVLLIISRLKEERRQPD